MSPSASRAWTGAATGVVVTAVVGAALVGTRADLLVPISCGFAVAVAWVIAGQEPRSPVGPALAWTTGSVALVMLNDVVLPDAPWSVGIWPLNLAGLLVLLLVFPDGPRRGRLWRTIPLVYAAATCGLLYCLWGTGDDLSESRLRVGTISILLVGLCLVLAAASVAAGYRRGGSRDREQIRWLMLAGSLVVVLLIAGWVGDAAGLPVGLAYLPFVAATVVLVPLSVGVAMVRHELFDIDRLLTETTAVIVTLACSAAIFALVVVVVSEAFSSRSGVGSASAAFVTALLLLPLHQFVARGVSRIVNPDRYVAVASMQRFVANVHAGRREPEEIEEALRDAQGDPALFLMLTGPGGWVRLDGSPAVEQEGYVSSRARSRSRESCSVTTPRGPGAGSRTWRRRRGCRSRSAGSGSSCARPWRRRGRVGDGWRTLPPPNAAAWSAISTTEPSSGCSRPACGCG